MAYLYRRHAEADDTALTTNKDLVDGAMDVLRSGPAFPPPLLSAARESNGRYGKAVGWAQAAGNTGQVRM